MRANDTKVRAESEALRRKAAQLRDLARKEEAFTARLEIMLREVREQRAAFEREKELILSS